MIKQDLKTYRVKSQKKTSRRISCSTDTTTKMTKNIDKVTGLRRPSGKHKKSSANDDIAILTEQFHKAKLFDNIRGRYRTAFPKINSNPLALIDPLSLKDWIFSSFTVMSQ